ncbi:MAG: tetratricopeptide repeat protein [Bacteroidota bacterium]
MIRLIAFVLLVALVSSCSIEQNNITSSMYHNMTAHYNGYFYAREKTREVEAVILKSLDDDPNQILRLFPKLDTTLAKSYAKDTEEIIKMASLSIQRHPNSRWVYDNYILVGLARLYDCDFPNAIQTFKYVNTKSLNPDLRHRALVHLVRTFTEHDEYDKAEEAFRFLEKEKMNRENSKNLLMEKAYFYQVRGDYDNMVRNLTHADSLLTRHDRRGRIYFIIGQVYQQLGFGAEAYNYYRKCLATNPEYEIDFYARLNLAQVARLDDSRDVKTIRKQFDKLLTDAKNVEFRDKIYYELGEFERKQNHLELAIANYQSAAHAGTNKRIQGMAYLRIGQLYFDSLKKYSLAKAYYDSAIAALPKEFDNYEAIKKRQAVLGDFVKYSETIVWQDSLLAMAQLDSATLRHRLDSTLTAKAKKEEFSKKKKKRTTGGGASQTGNNTFFQTEPTSTSDWYFGNPSAVSLGQSEFARIWGNIPLEDNWRRSNKANTGAGPDTSLEAPGTATDITVTDNSASSEDKQAAEIDKVFQQLPRSDTERQKALALIEEAYFNLGDLFYLQLNEKPNAAQVYEELLQRFPDTDHAPEVLYKLYLIEKERANGRATYFAGILTGKYPNSTFTKILLNPDYLKETSVATEKQKAIYKDAYDAYTQGNLRLAQEKTTQALALGETSFTPQLELLTILITGKTEDVTRYQFELGEYIKKYPDGELKPYAEQLLNTSRSFLEKAEKARGIRFADQGNLPHFFVIVYDREDKLTDQIAKECELFNKGSKLKLQTSNLVFNDTQSLTMVSELSDKAAALDYFDKITTWLGQQPALTTFKFDTFVITKENFQIFYRTKALDEYLTFFDRNYKKQNQ